MYLHNKLSRLPCSALLPFIIGLGVYLLLRYWGVWVRSGAHTRQTGGIRGGTAPFSAWMALVCGESVIVYRLL